MQHCTRALVAIALALPLGACHSFLGIHFARSTPRAERIQTAAATTTAATEAGRKQLAEGQTGLAIESFQSALANGEPVAAAVNGLGVAYARLGRDDLAQRFFQEAMAADPANSRYADNLTRLMRSPSFAMRSSAVIAAQAAKDSASMLAEANSDAATVERQSIIGKLQRLSRAEVHITTAAPQAAPLRSASAVDGRFKPLVRIALTGGEPKGFKPLVRIALPEPKKEGDKPGSNR